MGNLGLYQVLTTAACKVGGPKVLVGIIATGGAVAGKGLEIAGKAAYKYGPSIAKQASKVFAKMIFKG